MPAQWACNCFAPTLNSFPWTLSWPIIFISIWWLIGLSVWTEPMYLSSLADIIYQTLIVTYFQTDINFTHMSALLKKEIWIQSKPTFKTYSVSPMWVRLALQARTIGLSLLHLLINSQTANSWSWKKYWKDFVTWEKIFWMNWILKAS